MLRKIGKVSARVPKGPLGGIHLFALLPKPQGGLGRPLKNVSNV